MSIVASIIASSGNELEERMAKVAGRVSGMQLDIMDGKFVGRHSLDFDFEIGDIDNMEAHLMVVNPIEWVSWAKDKAGTIIFHYEGAPRPDLVIEKIRGYGRRAGMAISPRTPPDALYPYQHELDLALVLTVEPGSYGARFLPSALLKVAMARKRFEHVEVDGGINPDTIVDAYLSGANRFVVGSYLQSADDAAEALRKLRQAISW